MLGKEPFEINLATLQNCSYLNDVFLFYLFIVESV